MGDQDKTKDQLIYELVALRRSEEQYRHLINEMSDGYVVTCREQIVFANWSMANMLGCSTDDLVGRSWKEFLNPEMTDYIDQTPLVDLPSLMMVQIRRLNGDRLALELAIRPATYAGELAEFTLVRNVTERKRAEERLRQVNRALRMLIECNQAVIRATKESHLLHEICQIIVEVGKYRLAWVGFAEQDEGKSVQPVAQAGFEDGYLKTVNLTWADTERGRGPTGTAIRSGGPAAAKNVLTDPDYAPWRSEAVRRGYASSIALPLNSTGRTLGALNIYAPTIDAFDADEVNFLMELADDLAYGIQALRTRAKHDRAAAALRRRNRELVLLNRIVAAATSTLDVQQVLQIACQELAQAFELPQVAVALLDAGGKEISVLAEYLEPGRSSELGKTVPIIGSPVTEYILKTQSPLAVTDVQTDARLAVAHNLMLERGIVSLLVVPITLARGRVAGTIQLSAVERREFSEEEIALAQNAAAAAGQVLETARLYRALQRHADQLQETVARRTVELQAALERAQDADRVKSEFISNVSHELRTPLANLKLYLSLLARGHPEKRQAYQGVLHREADRLQALIESLLDLSRLDLGKTQANLQPIDLNLMVHTLASDRKELVADRGLQLEVDLAEALPPALADPKLLEQVLTNLLTNAVNYTPAGGKVYLQTQVDKERQWCTINVIDTGPGISAKDRAHLFERFYRGQAGRASDAPGTGLGLAICKEIMDLHRGRITLESEEGRGSTFTVWVAVAEQGI